MPNGEALSKDLEVERIARGVAEGIQRAEMQRFVNESLAASSGGGYEGPLWVPFLAGLAVFGLLWWLS